MDETNWDDLIADVELRNFQMSSAKNEGTFNFAKENREYARTALTEAITALRSRAERAEKELEQVLKHIQTGRIRKADAEHDFERYAVIVNKQYVDGLLFRLSQSAGNESEK
jgi:hypothetical protein